MDSGDLPPVAARFDMLGVCRLPWIEPGLNEQHYARFYSAITGRETTLQNC